MAKIKQTIYDILKGGFLVDEGAAKNWMMLV
ncbi:MAG TPA: S-adenosyl-methyltransferase, partial [Flavobacteriaceae bacterium]|nr:S-adenosyl-methyltransferase [Flavobacteriaceae bacterium]